MKKQTLEAEIPNKSISGKNNIAVKSALLLIENTHIYKEEHEADLDAISDLFDEQFEVVEPSGNRKIPSYILQQALNMLSSKTKFPSFTFKSPGRDTDTVKLVNAGLDYVIDKAGLIECLSDGFGTYRKTFLFGDAFIRVGADLENDFPVQFKNGSLVNHYIDPFALDMRNPGSEHDVDEIVSIFTYSWDEAITLYPELEKKGTAGRIPSYEDYYNEEIDETQLENVRDRETQIAYYYNKSKKNYTVFAGADCTILEEFKDDEYPYMKDDKPYIPIIHLKHIPTFSGFYNKGLGHLLYKISIISRILANKGINSAMFNANPLRFLNVPKNRKSSVLRNIKQGLEMQKKGLPGVIVNEVSPADVNTPSRLESFTSEQLTNEWERTFNYLDSQIRRLGLNLDGVNISPNQPLGSVEIEEENKNEYIKEFHKINSAEYRFTLEIVVEFIKEFVVEGSKYYDTPIMFGEKININLSGSEMQPEREELEVSGVTLGQIADELRTADYYVEINTSAGTVNSRLLNKIRLQRQLQYLQGTKASQKVIKHLTQLDGLDLTDEDLQPMEQPGMEPGQAPEELLASEGGGLEVGDINTMM